MASINIVLKAVDQYSSTITGLNQGFDLVSKAISGLKAVADVTWNAIKTGANFAYDAIRLSAEGGAYAEMRRQFENVARSFNVDSDAILKDLQDITFNMIELPDAIRLAGQGIRAGFGQEELSKIFTFVKRDTELTGKSFEDMSNTIITSLAKGRFNTLKEFGIIAEKGDTVRDVIQKIEERTKSYGDTGFNAADKLKALETAQKNFTLEVGKAINESTTYQKALTFVTDTVVKFVRGFDTSPITKFTEIVSTTFTEMIRTINALGFGDWLKRQRDDIAQWVSDVANLLLLPVKYLQEVVQELAAFQRNNPLLSKAIYGDFFNPEGFAQAEVSFDKIIRSMERGAVPAKALGETSKTLVASAETLAAAEKAFAEATEAAVEARKQGLDTTEADARWRAAKDELDRVNAILQQSNSVTADSLRRESGIDDLNSELDEMLQKAKAPVEPAAALQTAATRATQPQGIEAATAGLNSQSVLLALGNWLLQHIVNKASTERAPMAILATN